MTNVIQNSEQISVKGEADQRIGKKDGGANKLLAAVGERMAAKKHTYMGSAAFHIYINNDTKQFEIVAQAPLGQTSEGIANLGIKELARHCMSCFGRKVPVLRDETPWEKQDN